MPTYEYACKNCGSHIEVVQSFTDDALTTCETCGGDLRKVFGAIGITFKGSGFYKTDSRPAPAAASSSGSSNGDAKPAETKTAETKSSDSSSTSSPDSAKAS